MFALFGKNRIDEDTVNDVIDFLNDNPSIKKRILREILDKEIIGKAIVDLFYEEGEDLHCLFQQLADRNIYELKKHVNDVFDKTITEIDIDNNIKEKIDGFIKKNPKYKTLDNLDEEIKEIKNDVREILTKLDEYDITTTFEKLKEKTKK